MPVQCKTLKPAIVAALLALSLGACNQGDTETGAKATAKAPEEKAVAVCSSCGTVSNIEELRVKGSASGTGAVAGAIIGGVVGHQFGGGKGKDVATVAGAAGGAYAGHEAEKRYNSSTRYRVTVTLEAGGTRTVETQNLNGAGVGSKVKVSGSSIQLI